jgi:hypothetical protein
VTLVADLQHPDTVSTAIRGDASVHDELQKRNIVWRVYDVASPEMDAYGFRPALAKAGALPAVILQRSDGKVVLATAKLTTALAIKQLASVIRKEPTP